MTAGRKRDGDSGMWLPGKEVGRKTKQERRGGAAPPGGDRKIASEGRELTDRKVPPSAREGAPPGQ